MNNPESRVQAYAVFKLSPHGICLESCTGEFKNIFASHEEDVGCGRWFPSFKRWRGCKNSSASFNCTVNGKLLSFSFAVKGELLYLILHAPKTEAEDKTEYKHFPCLPYAPTEESVQMNVFKLSFTGDGSLRYADICCQNNADDLSVCFSAMADSLASFKDKNRSFCKRVSIHDHRFTCIILPVSGEYYFLCVPENESDETQDLHLTPREEEISFLAGCGLSNKLIASYLFVSEGTVKKTLSNAFRKKKVSSRADLFHKLSSRENNYLYTMQNDNFSLRDRREIELLHLQKKLR